MAILLRESGQRGRVRLSNVALAPARVAMRQPGKRARTPRVRPQSSRSVRDSILRARTLGDAPALLVYVHGIGPQPEPVPLKRQWDDALFGHPLGERTRMAYWADVLHPLGGTAGSIESLGMLTAPTSNATTLEMAREAVARTTEDSAAVDWASLLLKRMLNSQEIADAEGIEPRSNEMEIGSFNARVLPPGRLRRRVTELITRAFIQDVAAYFFDNEIRSAIQRRLSDLLVPDAGPYVLVTHSLGTVIAYDVLRSLGKSIDAALWVTLGSPLGIDEVQDGLKPPLEVPGCVLNGKWRNFADRLDPVALDPDLASEFTPTGFIDDVRVLNPHTLRVRGFNPHSALGYLAHSAVREAVRDVVGLSFSAPASSFVMASDIAAEAVGPPNRHHVLIQLDDALEGDDLERRRLRLKEEVEALTNGSCDAEIDCLQRYVAANLTPHELQVLRARHTDLCVQRFWKNSTKKALLKTSTHRVQARTAQIGYQATGKGITWAVLDTGIRGDHPHFKAYGNVTPECCWNCTRPGGPTSSGIQDEHGHGTHVAGIIAGQEFDPKDQNDAYYGMAPQTKLHIYKVLRDDGEGRDSWIIKALDHIAIMNERSGKLVVHGVNLSLGGPFDPEVFGCGHSPICEELRRLWRMGVIVCVAAGNEGVANLVTVGPDGRSLQQLQLNADLSIGDPANLDEAIAVGSVHKEFPHLYGVSYFSSRGPTADGRAKPDVVAPGEKIESCNIHFIEGDRQTHYVPLSGTSMACPHVSGLLAAYLSVRREFIGRPDEVKRLLLRHAIDLNRNQYHQGAGMPNLIHMLAGT